MRSVSAGIEDGGARGVRAKGWGSWGGIVGEKGVVKKEGAVG